MDAPTPTPRYSVKVNGLSFVLSRPRVKCRIILQKAYDVGAFPSGVSWGDYVLVEMSRSDSIGHENWVDLEEDNEFLTIPRMPTPVAFCV